MNGHAQILADLEANRGSLENLSTKDLEEAQNGWHDSWYIDLYRCDNSLFSPDFDLHCDIAFELDRRRKVSDMDRVEQCRQAVINRAKKTKNFF